MTKVLLATTALAGAVAALAYSASLSATGGTGPYTFQLAGGALPDGLSLDASGGISGTPSAEAEGTSTFTVTATDADGEVSDPVGLSIVVSPAAQPEAEPEPAPQPVASAPAAHGLLDEIEGKISELRKHIVTEADQAIADAEKALNCAHDELVAAVAKVRQALTGASA